MAEMTLDHAHGHDDHHHHETPEQRELSIANQKLAVWAYLASEVVIFAIMIAGFILLRINEPEFVERARDELGIALVTINTFILLASSWAMVMGLREIQKGNRQGMLKWIGLTALMGTSFRHRTIH